MPPTDRSSRDLAAVSAAYALLYLVACLGSSASLGAPPSPGELLPFLALLGLAAAVRWRRVDDSPLPWVAAWALWPALYQGSVDVVSRRPDRFVDPLLARADAWLLGRAVGPPTWPLGGPVEELANLFYTSYYLVLPAGFHWLWRARHPHAARRYTLGVLGALFGCAAIWILVPAGGYHPGGGPVSAGFGPFTAVARGIYAAHPHHAAAFPSSHVALACAAAGGLTAQGGSRAWWLWAIGVAWATIYGQYHYAVDAPPGLLVGVAAVTWAHRDQLAVARLGAAQRSG